MSKFNNGEKIPEPKLNLASMEAMLNMNLATEEEKKQLGAHITNTNPTSAQNN